MAEKRVGVELLVELEHHRGNADGAEGLVKEHPLSTAQHGLRIGGAGGVGVAGSAQDVAFEHPSQVDVDVVGQRWDLGPVTGALLEGARVRGHRDSTRIDDQSHRGVSEGGAGIEGRHQTLCAPARGHQQHQGPAAFHGEG